MKKEIALKWISALRSGKYKQTNNTLKNSFGYCCLGVLCDISEVSEWDSYNEYENNNMFLPESVKEWAGMSSDVGKFPDSDGPRYSTLMSKNDSGSSFNEIADLIETNWEKL